MFIEENQRWVHIYKNKFEISDFCTKIIFTFVIFNEVKNEISGGILLMETIKDRLAHILRAKNLTASQFAELMEIQPSNVSHLLNGRNNPSLDFLIKLKELFPEYSFDWIIMGKKPITINEPAPLPSEENQIKFDEPVVEEETQEVIQAIDPLEIVENTNVIGEKGSIEKMILVYSDKTFEILESR